MEGLLILTRFVFVITAGGYRLLTDILRSLNAGCSLVYLGIALNIKKNKNTKTMILVQKTIFLKRLRDLKNKE